MPTCTGGFRNDAELTDITLLSADADESPLCLGVGWCDDLSCETKRISCTLPIKRYSTQAKTLLWAYNPITKQIKANHYDALSKVDQGSLCLTVMDHLDQWYTNTAMMKDQDMANIHNGISVKLWRCNADPSDVSKDLSSIPRSQQWYFDSRGRLVPKYDHLSALGPSQDGTRACHGCKFGSGADVVNNMRRAGTGAGWDDARWVIKPTSRWTQVELGYAAA